VIADSPPGRGRRGTRASGLPSGTPDLSVDSSPPEGERTYSPPEPLARPRDCRPTANPHFPVSRAPNASSEFTYRLRRFCALPINRGGRDMRMAST